MFNQIKSRLDEAERRLRSSFGNDISTPRGRRAALWHFHLMDHAFLRVLWRNMGQVAPGVWRSNQPSPGRIKRYADMGIKTIINLRGASEASHYLLEEEASREHGIELVSVPIAARRLVVKRHLLRLLDLFETVERPFLMHCKSGADRAGLASALYLMHIEGKPVEEAKRQLSLRHLHLKNDNTGVLDFMLDRYAADTAETPMPIREWIETRYDHKALNAAFAQSRNKRDG